VQRLKTRNQFQAVLAGSTVARTVHFALHRCAIDGVGQKAEEPLAKPWLTPTLFVTHDVWIGAMVPKRWAKRAVTRNAIKRQIYTIGASFESALPVAAHLVRLRLGFDKTKFASATSDALKLAVRQELDQLFLSVAVKAKTVSAGNPAQ
jgi:ribonuclease P protein component